VSLGPIAAALPPAVALAFGLLASVSRPGDRAREREPTDLEQRFQDMALRHQAAILRLCRYRERDPHLRTDLLQDVLLALWEAFPTLRDAASERAFVLRVAHNVAATHVHRTARRRRARAEGDPELAEDPVGLEGRLEDRSRLRALDKRLRALDLASEQLVLLHLEGLSAQEIAQATGLSPTNVTTRLSRIRKALEPAEPNREEIS
jgi:RNA polymerase sigma factor (sigma-70 family)